MLQRHHQLKEIYLITSNKTKPIFYSNHRSRKAYQKSYKLSDDKIKIAKNNLQNKHKNFLEIGFGTGDSVINMLCDKPNNYYCIESYYKGIENLNSLIKKNNLENIFVFHGDAIDIIENFFPNDSIDYMHIFFPDPWPKKKHRKRRLINLYSIDMLFNKLKENGKFHFTTDHINYAYSVRDMLSKQLKKSVYFSSNRGLRPITSYEKKAYKKNNLIFDLIEIKVF